MYLLLVEFDTPLELERFENFVSKAVVENRIEREIGQKLLEAAKEARENPNNG